MSARGDSVGTLCPSVREGKTRGTSVVPNSDLCQIITPLLVLVGLGLGLGVGEGLGLGNQIAISTRGVIIWQGVENGHNTGTGLTHGCEWVDVRRIRYDLY